MTWRPDPRDLLLLLGFGLAVYGVWLIFEPAAFILAGVAMVLAWAGSLAAEWLRFVHAARRPDDER